MIESSLLAGIWILILFFAIAFNLTCALFSCIGAIEKGRSGFGWFFAGLIFGLFGLLVYALPNIPFPYQLLRNTYFERAAFALNEDEEQLLRRRLDL